MLHHSVGGLTICHDPAEKETADLIAGAVERALKVIADSWGLRAPGDCRISVMTDWRGFLLGSAPWHWRILLSLTQPLWAPRARRTWPCSAAWTQRYGRRIAIGIKPPRLLAESDRRAGAALYAEELDPHVQIEHVTCHELTHACSAHLRLPAWLNEGLAQVTVDRFLSKRTIRADTVNMVCDFMPKTPPPSYRQLSYCEPDALAYHVARGYWVVQYLEHVSPGLVRSLLEQRSRTPYRRHDDLGGQIAVALGMPPERFWDEIDGVIAACCASHGGAGHHDRLE